MGGPRVCHLRLEKGSGEKKRKKCENGRQNVWQGASCDMTILVKNPFFLQVSVRFKKQELQMYTYVKQNPEWVGYGQIHPRRCNHSCNNAVYKRWETLEPLPYCQGCVSGENKEDGNSVLMLLLNCLLDKQGTVLCSMLCVYFSKGTPFWGLRGPEMNRRDGCWLNLARLNAQQ